MSNLEIDPVETDCVPTPPAHSRPDGLAVEILTARDVPLGGPRAMTVHRTLPQRQRSLIGAWCFLDHYGPDDVSVTGGMDVPPHPHTGLQTASWLFTGTIEHRDTKGNHAMVLPGELNLMTAGHGIAHTEVSTPDTTVLHGVQLWIALPDNARETPHDFAHYAPPEIVREGLSARVFLGTLLGSTSPVTTFTPLVGAEITLAPGSRIDLDVDPAYEHGILVDLGEVVVDTTPVPRRELAYVGIGTDVIPLSNPGDEPARIMLLGGQPFGEEILMWWNFVGRTHEEIVGYRTEWENHSERFGQVQGYEGPVQHLPAPPLPHTRLRTRVNPPPRVDD